MSQVIALVPARAGSKGIPGKNFRELGGKTLVRHAVDCAKAAGIRHVCVSTDNQAITADDVDADVLWRGPELSADDTPMIAVVRDFVERMAMLYTATHPVWTGKPVEQTLNEQIIVLLQPTQPFRKPERIQQAIALLQESGTDSVVSVVPLPLTHHAQFQLFLHGTEDDDEPLWMRLTHMPSWRQAVPPAFTRDGTVYAFRRSTVTRYGTIYGQDCRPLILDPSETCELDTEADWAAVQARWQARHG